MRRYPFGKFILDIPDNHRILDIHRKDILYDRLHCFAIELLAKRRPNGVLLDIGANVGDSAALMASVASNPIVAVEGSDEFLPYLRRNAAMIGAQVSIIDKFVNVPALNAVALAYEARPGSGALKLAGSIPGESLPDSRFIDVSSVLAHCKTISPETALVKCDTDGCDGFIVSELLQKVAAPIYFECDTTDLVGDAESPWPALFKQLDSANYSIVIWDNSGLPMCAVDQGVGSLLRDLSGYIHMQHCVGLTKIYYLDVLAFPPTDKSLFVEVAGCLRDRYLRPYLFRD
jgi:FkbM family methyltransferase